MSYVNSIIKKKIIIHFKNNSFTDKKLIQETEVGKIIKTYRFRKANSPKLFVENINTSTPAMPGREYFKTSAKLLNLISAIRS